MSIRGSSALAHLSVVEGSDDPWPVSPDTPPAEEPDWHSLFEGERARAESEGARADAAEARVQELLNDIRRLRAALRKAGADEGASGPQPRIPRRLLKAWESSQHQNDTIGSLRMENAELCKEVAAQRKAAQAARTSLSRKDTRLLNARESSQAQRDTIKELRRQVRSLERQVARQSRELEEAEGRRQVIRELSGENTELRAELRELRDQSATIEWLRRRVGELAYALDQAADERRWMEADLADRPLLPVAFERLRAQEKTIQSLTEKIARLPKEAEALRARIKSLEATVAKYRTSRAVLSKALFGSRSEQQEKPRSGRKRGQQRGAPGHGRTQRPGLAERTDKRNPPKDARVCSCCGKPYVANGEHISTIIEIEVKAHKRRIVRPRWRRGCDCPSSPLEVTAPPPLRLFARTPYGISVWACFLYERYASLRPLNQVSAWLSGLGLPIAAGTLAGSVERFIPVFGPVADAILAHQNQQAGRHGDETGWRIQSLREIGRSSRAWLWNSVSEDAVYFHSDPSRSAEVAKTLFGETAVVVFVVCDRLSSYKKMARDLDGKVILCFCWVHQRRDFIECAAGHNRLTEWCQSWIERIASIYSLNKARLEHYEPALERQTPEFDAAQGELEKAVDKLFADAEAELAGLSAGSRKAKPLRSLLNHREGLSVFVDNPQVPMDNNAAERAFRRAVIGRRLSFGSDSEDGAKFTAMMYSVVGTLAMNGIDVRRWLQAWLKACAKNGGKPPDDLSPWLPWSMSEERRRKFTAPG